MSGRHVRRSKPRYVLILWIALFSILLFVSTYKVIAKTTTARQEQETFDTLAAMKEQSAQPEVTPALIPVSTSVQTAQPVPVSETDPDAPSETSLPEPINTPEPEPTPLPEYAQLYELNPEFFGWLTIEAVGIDYPVMYAPTRSEYYLNRDFYGKYSDSGIPFIDGHCPRGGNYYLIYGHHMQNKTMFGQLPKYADKGFWAEYPMIRFDTVYEQREYIVMAAFLSRIYDKEARGVFRYYEYFDLSDEAVFNEYVRQVKAAALYDTGIDAEYGDELLVLSTCNYHTANGRFVVVAKRVS